MTSTQKRGLDKPVTISFYAGDVNPPSSNLLQSPKYLHRSQQDNSSFSDPVPRFCVGLTVHLYQAVIRGASPPAVAPAGKGVLRLDLRRRLNRVV